MWRAAVGCALDRRRAIFGRGGLFPYGELNKPPRRCTMGRKKSAVGCREGAGIPTTPYEKGWKEALDREKRPGKRERRRLFVRFGVKGPKTSGFTTNFTEGGVHIQTNRVMSPGTQLHIELHGPHQTFGLRARVVWAKRGLTGGQVGGRTTGMGLKILEPGPEWIEFCRRDDIDKKPAASGSR